MSESSCSGGGSGCAGVLIAVGVFCALLVKTEWWRALLYAIFWPIWFGYRLAEHLWR